MPPTRWLCGVLLLLLGCAPTRPTRPAIVAVAATAQCPHCELIVDTLTVLSGPPEALVEWPQSAWTDSRGRIIITQPNKGVPPAVFAPDGRFLQFVGRAGEGPGEFRLAAHVTGDATDTLFVADWGTGRLSVVGPDLTYVRSYPFPRSVHSLSVLSDGRILSNSRSPGATPRPLSAYSRAGRLDASFGFSPEGDFDYQYHVARSIQPGFWAARLWGRHLWGHLSPQGGSAWFESSPPWFAGFPDDPLLHNPPPHSRVLGLWESPDGLWIAVQVAGDTPGFALDTIRPEGIPVEVAREPDQAYDTMLELLHPETGQTIAVRRLPDVYAVVAGPGRLLHVRESDTGLQLIVVGFRLKR